MLGAEGEGGLGINLGLVKWDLHSFDSFEDAIKFFDENKEKTDGRIHPHDDFTHFSVFTRKENVSDDTKTGIS